MRKLLPIAAFLFPWLLYGQTGLIRVELEAALNSNIYQVASCGSRGVMVFFETKDVVGDNAKNWHFMFYDTQLEETWNADIPVITGANFKDYDIRDSLLLLFFMNEGK